MKPEEIKVGGVYRSKIEPSITWKVVSINTSVVIYARNDGFMGRCTLHTFADAVQPLPATQPELTKCQSERLSRLPTDLQPMFDAAYTAKRPTDEVIMAMCLDCVGPENGLVAPIYCKNDICPLWRTAQAVWAQRSEVDPDPMDPGV